MANRFTVVDLFAGPGGLAEGFAAYRDRHGDDIFQIALSVEKEAAAFTTLRMRAFTRQFGRRLPQQYYDVLGGRLAPSTLTQCYPREWATACRETVQMELGGDEGAETLHSRISRIARESGGNTILIGGPPCQAYSLVGRARNRGVEGYDASQDQRHFLYREYIRILRKLKPAVFVMENVKGILSSRIDGEALFGRILEDLTNAAGPGSYQLVPLSGGSAERPADFLVRAEDYGVPQSRHRVIVVGIRSDIRRPNLHCGLVPQLRQTTVADVLQGMSRLRSGLSKGEDCPERWHTTLRQMFSDAAAACLRFENQVVRSIAPALHDNGIKLSRTSSIPPRSDTLPASVADNELGRWLIDPSMDCLPNHESRGHMPADLARYAFVATFGQEVGRSPKSHEFPEALAPNHRNWRTGKFADRFRVQLWGAPATTITSHISKDGHYFIHPDALQCRSLTVREAARLQTFPDNYFFMGNRTQQFIQVGNAVPPLLACKIAQAVAQIVAPEGVPEQRQSAVVLGGSYSNDRVAA